MLLSHGNPAIFFTRPISLAFLLSAAFLLVVIIAPTLRRKREEVF
jgi:putative tricarboxylic transport membrane protein